MAGIALWNSATPMKLAYKEVMFTLVGTELRATDWWVTGYNEPGVFWVMRGHDHVSTFGSMAEARMYAEASWLLEGGE